LIYIKNTWLAGKKLNILLLPKINFFEKVAKKVAGKLTK